MAKRRKRIVKPKYVTKEVRKKLEKEPMSRELKYGLAIGAAVLVLAVILFAVFYNDGSLPVKNGTVVVDGDSWIVSNLGSSSAKRYYKLGEITAIEGFAADPAQTVKSDTNEKDHWFVPDDENSQITHYYVTGVKQRPADMAAEVQSSFAQMYGGEGISEVMTATVGGYETTYFTAITVDTTSEPGVEKTTQMLCLYLPSIRDTSILVSVMLSVTEERPALSNEALLEFADRVVSKIVVEQPK